MFNEIVMVPNLRFLNVIISIIFVSGRISIIKEISIIKDRISQLKLLVFLKFRKDSSSQAQLLDSSTPYSFPSASTTTKKVRRPRPKPKTTPHPEAPQTILGKYVVYDLFCIGRCSTYLFRVKAPGLPGEPHVPK